MALDMSTALQNALNATLGKTTVPEKDITMIAPDRLITLDDQHYSAYSEDKLKQLAQSIKRNGQFAPCLVRRMPDGRLIVLAGRNRTHACKLAGVDAACIVKEYTDAEAEIVLNESNLMQRDRLTLSEKAKGYASLMVAYTAAGIKAPVKQIAGNSGECEKQVWRYVKLGSLDDSLLKIMEQRRIPMAAGVELAQLSTENQAQLTDYLQAHPDKKIDLEDAGRLRQAESWMAFSPAMLERFFPEKADIHLEQTDIMSDSEQQEPQKAESAETAFSPNTSPDIMSEPEQEQPKAEEAEKKANSAGISEAEAQKAIDEGLRTLGEEAVFEELVLRFNPPKDWMRRLKQSYHSYSYTGFRVACESNGITIHKGDFITIVTYTQAYNIIADLIRTGEWLPPEKMAELAAEFWMGKDREE